MSHDETLVLSFSHVVIIEEIDSSYEIYIKE